MEEQAIVRSAADRLVVTTARGIEAVYCSGLNQTLLYPGIPATLSAKPILSMTTKDQPGGPTTMTLAYIATGFDWDATYIGSLADDGRSMSLLGWMTMASADDTSFVGASTSAIAGRINRSDDTQDDTAGSARGEAETLDKGYHCWPAGTTSDARPYAVPPPMAAAPMMMSMAGADIIVTARRVEERIQNMPISIAVVAQAENLGDLKLYRIPVPVTVAARSQKQVAFLSREKVKGSLLYRATLHDGGPGDVEMLFRFRNRAEDGAGDPLPAGQAVIYQDGHFGHMLVGETTMRDKAVDEEVELAFGDAANVTLDVEGKALDASQNRTRHVLTVRNANPFAIRFELDLPLDAGRKYSGTGRLIDKPGKQVWAIAVGANDEARLDFESRN